MQVASKHHPKVTAVMSRETHIGATERRQACSRIVRSCVPFADHGCFEVAKSFVRNSGQQRLPINEVMVGSARGDAGASGEFAQIERIHPLPVDHIDADIQQRSPELAMVIAAFSPESHAIQSSEPRWRGWNSLAHVARS